MFVNHARHPCHARNPVHAVGIAAEVLTVQGGQVLWAEVPALALESPQACVRRGGQRSGSSGYFQSHQAAQLGFGVGTGLDRVQDGGWIV
jgi:hypothetical protein